MKEKQQLARYLGSNLGVDISVVAHYIEKFKEDVIEWEGDQA